MDGEIVPASTSESNFVLDPKFGAHQATDLDLETKSYIVAASGGVPWLRVALDQVHCVEQVIWLTRLGSGNPTTWTCSDTDCSTCEGDSCSGYTLRVFTEGAAPGSLSPDSSCKYGNMVELTERIGTGTMMVPEIAIIVKQGETAHYTCETYYILAGMIFTLFAIQ